MNKLKQAAVYWIRLPEHTDINNQGYVGVSKNPTIRWKTHLKGALTNTHHNSHLSSAIAKYKWNQLIKEIIIFGEESYCYECESNFRPISNIGWNIKPGGNGLPSKESNPGFWKNREKAEHQKYSEWTTTEEYKDLELFNRLYEEQLLTEKERLTELEQERQQNYLKYQKIKSQFKWIDYYVDDYHD